MKISVNIRISKPNKIYYLNQLQQFANRFNHDEIYAVEFGKQDIRGTESITLVSHNHTVPYQKHFRNSKEMLEYIVGYNDALTENCSLNRYLSKSAPTA